jgi:hypothetical protein
MKNHQPSFLFFLIMAYDPIKPLNNSPIVAAELRNQFAGLKDLIDARPARVDGVDALGLNASPDYFPTQIQEIADKLDELIAALKLP